MPRASDHPDVIEIFHALEEGQTDGPIAEHLRSCGLCGTLALSFERQDRSAAVDPSYYADKTPLRSGGMGRTFTARDVRIGREVVIKEPAEPSEASDPGASLRMERRLLRERRILGAIEHPAVVPIYESGQWPDGTPFFAMRRIFGPTLAEVIAGAPDFARRIVLLPQFISITEAIAHAHGRGIIHRDLAPDNMMLGPLAEPYVIDWGIATLVNSPQEGLLDRIEPAADGMTRGGIGKEPYAPLEQLAGAPVQATFDVYSLGATLHHLLAGRPPLRRSDGTIEPLPPWVPEELVSIVRRATAVHAAERFPDAGALARELRRYEQGMLVEAHSYTARARVRRWVGRHRAGLAVTLAAGVALLTSGAAYRWRLESERALASARTARSDATLANADKKQAQKRAAAAGANRDAAMKKWVDATAHSRALALELERERRLSNKEAGHLILAVEAERAAAAEAMELRLAAESARYDAEVAAQRARYAEQWALAQARSAEEAREAAESRAEEAELRTAEAESRAEDAESRARVAEETAARARADAAEAIAHAARARRVLEESLVLVGGHGTSVAGRVSGGGRPAGGTARIGAGEDAAPVVPAAPAAPGPSSALGPPSVRGGAAPSPVGPPSPPPGVVQGDPPGPRPEQPFESGAPRD